MIESSSGYIYETPDGGQTLYRRPIGSDDSAKELISEAPRKALMSYAEYRDIMDAAEENDSLKKALENCKLIYYTIKDDKIKNRT